MTAHPATRTLLAAAGTALAVTLLAACGGGASATGGESEGTALSHVHGLGVGSADGRVYVATHEGLYTVAAGRQPKLVGDRKDDFMGFTVTGESTFIAGGHGAAGSGRPGNLGLIESEDAGRTWTARSLEGDVDFHSLDSAEGTVYGYDGGRIRVSGDLENWDVRASLEALDLAVSPAGDTLLAATAEGVAASTDGGRAFGEAVGPVHAFMSWPAEKSLFGIDMSGKLSRSRDGGKRWQPLATVPGGQPQALTAVNAKRILAATQDGVYQSRDGGKTFTELAPLTS